MKNSMEENPSQCQSNLRGEMPFAVIGGFLDSQAYYRYLDPLLKGRVFWDIDEEI